MNDYQYLREREERMRVQRRDSIFWIGAILVTTLILYIVIG